MTPTKDNPPRQMPEDVELRYLIEWAEQWAADYGARAVTHPVDKIIQVMKSCQELQGRIDMAERYIEIQGAENQKLRADLVERKGES